MTARRRVLLAAQELRSAGVPLVLGYVDFRRKVAGLGPSWSRAGTSPPTFRSSGLV